MQCSDWICHSLEAKQTRPTKNKMKIKKSSDNLNLSFYNLWAVREYSKHILEHTTPLLTNSPPQHAVDFIFDRLLLLKRTKEFRTEGNDSCEAS